MRNYVKDARTVLREYDRECKELCYTAYLPQEVANLKKEIAAEFASIKRMEAKKSAAMRRLRDLFDPDKFNTKYAPYDIQGEPVVAE